MCAFTRKSARLYAEVRAYPRESRAKARLDRLVRAASALKRVKARDMYIGPGLKFSQESSYMPIFRVLSSLSLQML